MSCAFRYMYIHIYRFTESQEKTSFWEKGSVLSTQKVSVLKKIGDDLQKGKGGYFSEWDGGGGIQRSPFRWSEILLQVKPL